MNEILRKQTFSVATSNSAKRLWIQEVLVRELSVCYQEADTQEMTID